MGRPSHLLVVLFIGFSSFYSDSYGQTGSPPGVDTTCVNGILYYNKLYGGTKDDYGFHLAATADSGFVIAGQTNSFGNGGIDGLLTKVSKKGKVVWTKAIGGSGYDVFYSVRKTTDNGFIAIGQTKSYGNAAGDAWLVKLDASGTVQWSKKYGDGNTSGDIGYDVVQLSDGGYAFAGSHRFTPGAVEGFVVRTDNLGNSIWAKQYGTSGSDQLDGIVEDGNSLVVVGFFQGGSFYDGYVMKLDKSNGAVQWMKGYDGEGRSTWFSRINKTNTGYQVFAIITDDYGDTNQQESVWNLDLNGNLQNARKLVIPGTHTLSYGWLSLPDGGFVAANSENTPGSDVIICRVNASGSLDWSKKFPRNGRQQIAAITSSPEGGYAAVGYNNNVATTIDSNNVYLVRIDSLGNAGTCSGNSTTDLIVTTPSVATIVPPILDLGNVTINSPVITAGAVNVGPITNTLCSYCKSNITDLPPTGSDTSCLNGVTLYQKLYGGVKDEFGFNLVQTADSGFVVVGQTNSFGNGGVDGLLTKVNKKGNVVWSKALGGNGYDVLYTVKQTSDNGFIAVGQTKSFGNAAGDAWLVKLDASGVVQWSKKYGDGNANGEIAYDVVQLSDGGFAFIGSHRFVPGAAEGFVVRTDNLGNSIWAKQYGNPGSDQLTGILEDGNSLVVVGFFQGGSFYDSYVMKLDKSNGAVQWMKGFDGEGRSTWFSRIKKTNTGYQVFAVITDDYADTNQQESVWNLDLNGNLQTVRKLVIPGTHTISYGWLALPDGGFVAANSENNSGSDLIFCKVNASGGLDWSKKFLRNGLQQISAITSSLEGGYTGVGYNNNAGTTVDSNNVYLVKIDSLGTAGPCSGFNTTELTVITPSISTLIPAIADLGNVVISNPVITAGSVNFVPVTNNLCSYCQLNIPVLPADTVCSNGISLYQKVYGGTKDEFGFNLAPAADSGYVIAGQTNSFGNGGVDGLLMKVNKKGNVVWSKALGGSGYDVLYTVKQTSDNGFIAVGQTKSFGNAAGDAWLVKLDASGAVQWSKKYGDGNANGEIAYDVVQLTDGGYAFAGSHQFVPGAVQGFVVRTDNLGNTIWAKQYGSSGSDQLDGIVEDGNSLVVVGFFQGGSFYDGYVMKLDKTNGAVQWMKGYDGEGRSTWFSRIKKTNTGYQVFAIITDDYGDTNQQESIWNLDLNGNLQNVRKLVIPGTYTISAGWLTLPDGGFIAANGENNAGSDVIFCKVNAGGSLDWSKKFARNGRQQISAIISSPEGGYAGTGYNNNAGTTPDSNNVYIVRIDSLGGAGRCSGSITTDLSVTTPSAASLTPPITDLGNVTINSPIITVNVVNFIPVTDVSCFYCLPKATGTARLGETGRVHHQVKVFPNPVPGGVVNLSVEAQYADKAVISLVDLNGNVIAILAAKDIQKGNNLVGLQLPRQLQAYASYFIQVRFSEYTSSAKIFVVRQ